MYRILVAKIRKIAITKRLIIIFVFSTILPVSIICLFSSLSYQKSAYKKISDSIYQVLLAHNITINREITLQKNFSYNLLMNDTILEILESENRDRNIDLGNAVLKSQLTEYIWSTACDNTIITDIENNIRGSYTVDELQPDFREEVYAKLEELGKNDCWNQTQTIKGSKVLVFSKKIFSKDVSGKLIGYLHMVYDERRFFRNIYSDFKVGENSTMFVTDQDLNIVSEQHDKQKIGTTVIFENRESRLKVNDGNSFIDCYNGEKSLFIVSDNAATGWHVLTAIPCSYIDQDIYKTMFTLLVLAILILICSVAPILLVSSTIIAPVRSLSIYMDKVSTGNYQYDGETECNDELGKLTENCKDTVKHLVHVMDENEQKSRQQRELELKRLQAQINPHFLFNTLNSFKYIAMLNNMTVLDEGIGSLCNLLRQTIMQGDEFITVEQEFDNVMYYCKVQEIRYAGRFEIKSELSDVVKRKKVPRMILQPLIENCLVHGMKEEQILHIILKAYAEGSKMIILIKDDGRGIEKSDNKSEKVALFSGIGLKNVKERLEIIYGEGGIMRIISEKEQGTKIYLEIEQGAGNV